MLLLLLRGLRQHRGHWYWRSDAGVWRWRQVGNVGDTIETVLVLERLKNSGDLPIGSERIQDLVGKGLLSPQFAVFVLQFLLCHARTHVIHADGGCSDIAGARAGVAWGLAVALKRWDRSAREEAR